jgi:hypothetical protein
VRLVKSRASHAGLAFGTGDRRRLLPPVFERGNRRQRGWSILSVRNA